MLFTAPGTALVSTPGTAPSAEAAEAIEALQAELPPRLRFQSLTV